MKIKNTLELLKTYGRCPRCGSDKISPDKGSLIIRDKIFARDCKCGYSVRITTDEKGEVIEKLFSAKGGLKYGN